MFYHEVDVGMGDTDTTGVLFFPVQFAFAMRAFEAFLSSQGMPLSKLFQTPYLLPIVHAEGDYKKPLFVGDRLKICIEKKEKGISSLTFFYSLKRGEEEVGRVKLVHVLIDRRTRQKTEWPPELSLDCFRNSS
ncbi:MAG: hypothetical protein RLZZ453_345 [Chlamydiota bacterium]|jgi:acyl-CoA thioesterase FadM